MSEISDNKIILIIDKDSALADSLTSHLHNHEIIHVKTEMEAGLKYREIVEADKQINLIVLYDVTGNDSNWEAVLETLFDVSIQPNIIVLDTDPDIQKAVAAYSNMAYHYHDKKLTTHDDVSAWLAEIKANPVPQIKLDKSFYKDNVWSRHMKDRHEMMVEVKLGNRFEEKMDDILRDSASKDEDELSLIELAAREHKNENIDLSVCKTLIEKALRQPIDSLPKTGLLVIEDEDRIRENLVGLLRPKFDVITAPDSRTALKHVEAHPDTHLALMDVYLPDENGTELYPKLRAMNEFLNVIVLTAYKEMHVAEALIQKGAYGYINKPYNPDDLFVMLGRAWNKKVWPFFEGKLDLQKLSYMQRFVFLDHLLKTRRELAVRKTDPNYTSEGTLHQQNSQLDTVYSIDIYALFPELTRNNNISDDIF